MKYISTRGLTSAKSISEAIVLGLASDGGLYVPESWPKAISIADHKHLANLSFSEFSAKILQPFFADDPLQGVLNKICNDAFNFPMPKKVLSEGLMLLELFHGPTNAFKDFGARFLANILNEIPAGEKQKQRLVLVATSGDTGSAVAAAFSQCSKIPVAVLYPQGMISPRQEKQLTCWEPNGKSIAIDGSFDDCQRLVKQAFMSPAFKGKFDLISANSINLARLLPQMCYFAYQSLQVQKQSGFIIPSGNLGNAVAALWAKKMGFPITKIICAHNANCAVPNYFTNHSWQPLATVRTLANAMDVGNPSNFERMQNLYNESELWENATALSISDESIRKNIISVKSQYGEIICPHTATAFAAYDKLKNGNWIVVATAHPAKFETIVEPLIQERIEIPLNLKSILAKENISYRISADCDSLENLLSKQFLKSLC